MTDYEKEFQRSDKVCGEPFEEIAAFFRELEIPQASVLDLGCGQGRDAILAARLGHRVVGVDVAETGISQMTEQAEAERLDVTGYVADIIQFEPPEAYDVILLDRVLHMLDSDEVRESVLRKACTHTRKNGYVLVADTPSSSKLIETFFRRQVGWSTVFRKGNFHFAQNGAQRTVPRHR